MKLPKRLVFASLLLIASIFIPHLMIISILYILLLVAQSLPSTRDIVTRYILTTILAFCIFSIVGILGYFIHTSVLYVSFYLICIAGIIASTLFTRSKKVQLSQDRLFTGILGVLFTIPLLIFLQLPLLRDPSFAHLLQMMSFSSDNMSHLTLVSLNELNGGNGFGLDNAYNPPNNLSYYPQGWHFVGALFSVLLQPYLVGFSEAIQSLITFYLYSLLWMFLLLFLLAKLSLHFVSSKKKLNTSQVYILATSLSPLLAVCVVWIIPMFTHGFQTQISALVLLLAQALLLLEIFSSKNIRSKDQKKYISILVFFSVLVTVVTSLYWLFIIPVSYGIMFLSLVYMLYKKIFTLSKFNLLLLFVFALIGFLQVYVQQTHITPNYNLFNERGLIIPLSIEAILSFLILLTLAAKKLSLKWLWIISLCSWWAILFSIFAYIYQLSTIGELRYYYYKSLYTVVIFLYISTTYFTYLFFSWIVKNSSPRWLYVAGAPLFFVVILLTYLLAPIASRDYATTIGPIGFSGVHAQEILDTHKNHSKNIYSTLIIGSCDRSEDIRATYSLQSIKSRSYNKKQIGFSIYEIWPGKKEVLKESLQYLLKHNETVRVISIDRELSQYLSDTLKSDQKSRVEFIDRDQSVGNESVSLCPNRIR